MKYQIPELAVLMPAIKIIQGGPIKMRGFLETPILSNEVVSAYEDYED